MENNKHVRMVKKKLFKKHGFIFRKHTFYNDQWENGVGEATEVGSPEDVPTERPIPAIHKKKVPRNALAMPTLIIV